MAILPIVTYPDSILQKTASPVEEITDYIRNLLDDMTETMYEAPGIGLAAPQIGVAERLIVIDVGEPVPTSAEDLLSATERVSNLYQLINPVITHQDGEIIWEEGCLSLPDILVEMTRSAHVIVEAQDRDGKKISIDASGLLAVALQHEIDHLNGKLIIDNISRLKRNIYKDKQRKLKDN